MLEIKPDSPFDAWLETELGRRANHACVANAGDFRQAAKAVTRAGQIKDRDRHEKDDRRRIDDRREYVLGWSNQDKIEALIAQADRIQQRQTDVGGQVEALREKQTARPRPSASVPWPALQEYRCWDELDWEALVNHIAALA